MKKRNYWNDEWWKYYSDYKNHLLEIEDVKIKRFEIKKGVIIETEEKNRVEQNGHTWNGIKIVGKDYRIRILVKHEVLGFGWIYDSAFIEDDRNKANQQFLRLKEIAMEIPEGYTYKD